ncbi:MAG: hypothetical protein ABL997_08100 [Planctomycetota bacterium]
MTKTALRALLRTKFDFTPDAAEQKLVLLRRLRHAKLPTADAVLELHEHLCFLRAYPNDERVLKATQGMLLTFAQRRDLRTFAAKLIDTGIAGTAIQYPFFAPTAARLAEKFPHLLTVCWDDDEIEALTRVLPLLSHWAETPALDEQSRTTREWIDLQRGKTTDATYVVKRMQALHRDPFVFESAYEALSLWLRLAPGKGTPSRTLAGAPVARVAYQKGPVHSARPDLKTVLHESPLAVRELDPKEGARYVEMARDAMVTRQRDLDAFAYGDCNDVRLVEWEDGLSFAAIGVIPERRLLLEAVYGFLTLKNGIPMGYVLNSALFGSAEIAYNVFDTFRGGEAGHVYGRVLATVRALFGTDSFTIYPYQIGHENDEALQSGAWWFYQKLGFRSRDRSVLQLMRREVDRMGRKPGHRSSIATLKKLAPENVYYHMDEKRDDVIGILPLARVGEVVTRMLAERYGADRERGEAECVKAMQKLLSVPRLSALSEGERVAFSRWAPLVAVLPGVKTWSAKELKGLREVVLGKGARRESDFVRAFDQHGKLRRAVVGLLRA